MGKNVADVVNGMLLDAGSAMPAPTAVETRSVEPAPPRTPPKRTPQQPRLESPAPAEAPTAPAPPAPAPTPAAPAPEAGDATSGDSSSPPAPRTLRLRSDTAGELRAAWLVAKRDDVLLTAQDFASDLVEEALRSRRRRTRAAATA